MVNADLETFAKAWLDMASVLPGKEPTDGGIEMIFRQLQRFDLDVVLKAMGAYLDSGQFIPAPSQIIEHITGTKPTDQALCGLARDGNTPLGRIVRYMIGANIAEFTDRNLLLRVQTLRQKIDQFVDDAQSGKFSADHKRVLQSHGFSSRTELAPGLPGATLAARPLLEQPAANEQCDRTSALANSVMRTI